MTAKVYTQKEAKIAPIKKKTLAVIGYGSQGHAHALNLKDSGCEVIIGLYKGSKSIRVAKSMVSKLFKSQKPSNELTSS